MACEDENYYGSAETLDYFTFSGDKFRGKVLSVYDGDTLSVAFRWHGQLMRWKIRVLGVDTPELRGTSGLMKIVALKAKQFVLDNYVGKLVKISCSDFGSFGRLLAHIQLLEDTETLTERLLAAHLGIAYSGERRTKAEKEKAIELQLFPHHTPDIE
jgi:endonuclease YncB( thermonuclease family)